MTKHPVLAVVAAAVVGVVILAASAQAVACAMPASGQ
jgi:hypothetical protein